MKNITATLVAVTVLGITACASDSSSSATRTAIASIPAASMPAGSAVTDAAPAVGLTISGRAFGAATVRAGEPFTIVNEDGFGHTVTDRGGAFDVKVAGNSSTTLTIDQPGSYSIYCTIHPDMAGTITVE